MNADELTELKRLMVDSLHLTYANKRLAEIERLAEIVETQSVAMNELASGKGVKAHTSAVATLVGMGFKYQDGCWINKAL